MPVKNPEHVITPVRWDIFCRVIDNFGDIGFCWRLARLLTHTYQQSVRLWVDNLLSFQALCGDIDSTQPQQICQNIEICLWTSPFVHTTPADIVIEALGCHLPEIYLHAMAACPKQPMWINIEYLSAETWIEDCHGLASPHPTLPLVKYFFFPGFTARTGGILYEPTITTERTAFQADLHAQHTFWASLALPSPQANEKRLSLFCYDNPQLPTLLHTLANGNTPYTCLVPQGPAEKFIATYFQRTALYSATCYQMGNLHVYILPFLSQARYDQLLWACDINFVRGEDSFIRAQLAARPCVWHIYPQQARVHLQKLAAFLAYYAPTQTHIQQLWQAWNNPALSFLTAWQNGIDDYPAQQQHALDWAQHLNKQQNLAAKLILFCKNKIK